MTSSCRDRTRITTKSICLSSKDLLRSNSNMFTRCNTKGGARRERDTCTYRSTPRRVAVLRWRCQPRHLIEKLKTTHMDKRKIADHSCTCLQCRAIIKPEIQVWPLLGKTKTSLVGCWCTKEITQLKNLLPRRSLHHHTYRKSRVAGQE